MTNAASGRPGARSSLARHTVLARPLTWWEALGWLCALATALACERPPEVSVDLAALLPFAEASSETSSVDLGTVKARAHLIEGFGPNAVARDGSRFVRGEGPASVLRLFVGEPRDLALRLRARTLPAGDEDLAEVAVLVAGRRVAEARIGRRSRWYDLTIPGGLLMPGDNRIRFEYADADGSRVAWEGIEVANARSFGLPSLGIAGDETTLRLPLYASLAFYVRVPMGGSLRLGAVAPWTAGDGEPPRARLEIEVRAAGATAGERFALFVDEGGQTLDLAASDEPVRITLRAALSGDPPEAAAGLAVVNPALVTRRVPAPAVAEERKERPARKDAPNVIVYLIDTLRRDHLGVYGYPRGTSPHIDAFAREATVFTNAIAQASWTRPAVTSIFTGLNPRSHGVTRPNVAVPEGLPVLPALLGELGYRTAAIVTNANVADVFGFARGFDSWRYLPEHNPRNPGEVHQLSDRVNELAFRWLENWGHRGPFFLYLHTTDPHVPYVPRPEYRERFAPQVSDPAVGTGPWIRQLIQGELRRPGIAEELIGLYDAEVAFNDEHFGALLTKLRELDLYDDTLIVLISDHGEAFADHGVWQHGVTLYDEEIAIPLVIRLPGGEAAGRRVDALARQIDVLPTLLDALGATPLPEVQGRSLLPALRGEEPGDALFTAFSHLSRNRGEWESAVQEGRKLIRTRAHEDGSGRIRLFELEADPDERDDRAESSPVWRGFLLSQLDQLARQNPVEEAPAVEIDPELRERLRALGYL